MFLEKVEVISLGTEKFFKLYPTEMVDKELRIHFFISDFSDKEKGILASYDEAMEIFSIESPKHEEIQIKIKEKVSASDEISEINSFFASVKKINHEFNKVVKSNTPLVLHTINMQRLM